MYRMTYMHDIHCMGWMTIPPIPFNVWTLAHVGMAENAENLSTKCNFFIGNMMIHHQFVGCPIFRQAQKKTAIKKIVIDY